MPGPDIVQFAFGSQPPLFVRHALIGVHVIPLPEYPVLHAHETVPAPVDVHCAVEAQPPLLVAQALTPVHVFPLPV